MWMNLTEVDNMSKRNIIIGLTLQVILFTGLALHGGRYDFRPKQTVDISKELSKRFKVVDSNLVFDDKVLTITLPGDKGDKGDTGMTGAEGRDGIDGKDGVGKVGPPGLSPQHKWENTSLLFQLHDGTWGTAINLLGSKGRQGKQGNSGIDGTDGSNGRNGIDGVTPIKGIDYFDGTNGINGKDGEDGIDGYIPQKGIDYFDGVDGQDGKNGKDGEDAILQKFAIIQVLTEVKLASNGKLIKTYTQIKVYKE